MPPDRFPCNNRALLNVFRFGLVILLGLLSRWRSPRIENLQSHEISTGIQSNVQQRFQSNPLSAMKQAEKQTLEQSLHKTVPGWSDPKQQSRQDSHPVFTEQGFVYCIDLGVEKKEFTTSLLESRVRARIEDCPSISQPVEPAKQFILQDPLIEVSPRSRTTPSTEPSRQNPKSPSHLNQARSHRQP